jgi:hypothetical protein
MSDAATLCDLARAEIEKLKAKGIEPSPDEIIKINALAHRVITPETRVLLSRGLPVRVGGAVLWPLTLCAIEWLNQNQVTRGDQFDWIGYAMAHGRVDDESLTVYGRVAKEAVSSWVRSLRCTDRELMEGVAQCSSQDDKLETPPDNTGTPMSIGDFSAFLAINCGADPGFWERRVSAGYTLAILSALVQQNHADKFPCKDDPRIVAERALGYYIEKIETSRKDAD